MKLAISFTLIVCLMASALPLTAQAQTERPGAVDLRGQAMPVTAGPLVSAMRREALQLAAAGEPTGGEAIQQSGKPGESNWSRVRELAPGAEIVVMVKGSSPAKRYFVAGDEVDLTVLNLTDSGLPRAVRDVLRGLASSHPEYFPAAEQGGQFVLEKSVRLGPDGMFLTDRRVAGLTHVIVHIARTNVAEITDPGRARAAKGDLALLPLVFTLGGIAGAFVGAAVDGGPCSGVSNCASDAVPKGLFVGGLMGGVGAIALARNALFSHKTTGVIYRAP